MTPADHVALPTAALGIGARLGPATFVNWDWNNPASWVVRAPGQMPRRAEQSEVDRVIEAVREKGWLPNNSVAGLQRVSLFRESDSRWLLHTESAEEPAVVFQGGTRAWFWMGELHRAGGLPAVERECGDRAWFENGQLHREGDLPAQEMADGTRSWWRHGRLHRDGGQPAQIFAAGKGPGVRTWFIEGKTHREDGPSYISGRNLMWHLGGVDFGDRVWRLIKDAVRWGCYIEIVDSSALPGAKSMPHADGGAYYLTKPDGTRRSRLRSFPRKAWLTWIGEHAGEYFPELAAAMRAHNMHRRLSTTAADVSAPKPARQPRAGI